MSYTCSPILEEGRPTGAVVIVHDITVRKRFEERLGESEVRFRTLAEAVSSFLFETDAAGGNIWMSEEWCRFTGRTPEQLSGHGWADALHPENRAANLDQWLHSMENCVLFESQQRLRRIDVYYAWVIARRCLCAMTREKSTDGLAQ